MYYCDTYGDTYASSHEEAVSQAQASFDRDPEVQMAHAGMKAMEAAGRPDRAAVHMRRLERIRIRIAAENSDIATDVDPEDIVI